MIILPYGHDQTVYGRQWIVMLLIVLNALVFGATFLSNWRASEDIRDAAAEVDRIHAAYPDATVRPRIVETLSGDLRTAFLELVSDDPDAADALGNAALERATKRLVAAVNAKPQVRWGYRPGKPTARSAVTSLFIHGDLWHLVGNMLFLWLAGAVIECFWEALPFTILYLLAGLGGVLAHHLSAPQSMVPLVGASGAIAGIMGAFVVGHPRTKIKILYATWLIRPVAGTVSVPAWLLIPAWIGLQLGYAVLASGDGVAYWAHVGGFVVGVAGALVMRWGGWVSYDADEVLGKPR